MISEYAKSGTHPLIQEYNQLHKRLVEMDREITKAERDAPKPSPRYKLTDAYPDARGEGVRFTLTLQNKQDFTDYMNRWGSCPAADEKIHSVGYKVVNGVLMRFGGGNLIWGGWDDVVLLTDDEWSSLLSLKVPDKLRQQPRHYIIEDGA